MGILEIHTWNATARDDLEQPDRIVIDLDPGPERAVAGVIAAARLVRARPRAGWGSRASSRRRGGKGLHVVVPLAPRAGWDECRRSRGLAEGSSARRARRASSRRCRRRARTGKIFVDYLRNERGATAVAAYSTRARPGAPVSTPLAWDELSPRLPSDAFRVANLAERLVRLKRDPWARYWTLRQRLPAGGIADDATA